MAATGWRTSPALDTRSVERSLFERGFCFDFFQAVRLLHRMHPDAGAVGTTSKAREEVCRFSNHASLAFPPSAIDVINEPKDNSDPVQMTVAFMGLFGEEGVLPAWYTERIIARKMERDRSLEAFLNLFNHRIISLFYQAWLKHQPAVQYESAAIRKETPDAFTSAIYDLIGMGTPGLRGRAGVPDPALARYSGLIVQRPRSTAALRSILRDYFQVRVAIEQFIGAWYQMDIEDLAWLRRPAEQTRLGRGVFIGSNVWDQQSRIRLRLGPLSLRKFLDFLPGSRSWNALVSFTRYLLGQSLAFDVQLVLFSAEVPYCRLTDRGQAAPRLGQMAWLKTREFRTDPDDALFRNLTFAA